MNNPADKDKFNNLARQMKSGDDKAAGEIFNYFSPILYRFFLSRTLNKQVSEDLTQEVFLKLVSKIDLYDEGLGNFSGWLWQIARNSLTDYFRSKKETAFSDLPDLENIFSHKDSTEKNMKIKDIMALTENFNDDDREIFSLYYVSDLSYRDIGKITGKTEGSLRILIHRMIKKIKKEIN